ncbi:MAG: acyl-CoA thioesterase [Alphaproteobacteria bacterium]|nr:acyl-CoA thioesterase [Alphaproteobacteria bacterium]
MTAFKTEIQVHFQHCDPAGIVFFPRFYEMLNTVVERWFEEALAIDFHTLHQKMNRGIPAVRTEADFVKPSRLSEILSFALEVEKLGGSSMILRVTAHGPDHVLRVRFHHVVVFSTLGPPPKPVRIPDDLRARISTHLLPPPR